MCDHRQVIAGIGIDVVAVPGFAEQLARPGTAFTRAFTPGERRACAGQDRDAAARAKHYAARWAAKEAFIKAWSAAVYGGPPVLPEAEMREIEVVADAWGRPGLRLSGEVAVAVRASLGEVVLHVSLSHDGDVAAAYVVIERAG
ncbi:holo-ACP synthase [Tomitella cavernea]|uniref:Holo-[acyl-carrier-protein] synthase n=1 Tax=Tomitella cavernea TaxID=1387982 RepID=A0ABP9CUB6_9ACTN